MYQLISPCNKEHDTLTVNEGTYRFDNLIVRECESFNDWEGILFEDQVLDRCSYIIHK